MSLLGQTDWSKIDGKQPVDGGWTPLPTGTYYFVVKTVQDVPNKKGTGVFTQIEFECLDDSHKGEILTGRYNLNNPNPTAVNIARKEIKAMADAIGVIPTGADVLIGRVLKIEVECRQQKDDPSRMENNILRYLPSGAAPPVPQMEASAARVAQQSAAGDEPTPF